MVYGLIEVLLDVAILSDWGDWNRTRPNTHDVSFRPEQVDAIIDHSLAYLKNPNMPTQYPADLEARFAAWQRKVGKDAVKEMRADMARISEIVREATQGLNPEQLRLLEESSGAKALMRDYIMLSGHVASKAHADPKLAKAMVEALPELRNRIGNYARDLLDHGEFDDLLRHTIKDEELLGSAFSASSQAQHAREVTQSFGAAFSSWSNFKASLGCAAFVKNSEHVKDHRNFGRSVIFYAGGVLAADSAVHLIRPELNKSKDKHNDKPIRSFTYNVAEGLAGMGMLIGAIVAAGRRIPLK